MDTNVFSELFITSRDAERRQRWRTALTGMELAIAFQTREEVLAGARANGWGARRMSRLAAQTEAPRTIWVTADVIDASAELYAQCRQLGRALHKPEHRADRWIAACAIAYELPLATEDRVFSEVPGLHLLQAEDTDV